MKKIFVHGLGQNAGSWEKTIEKLGDAKDCICFDLIKMLRGNKVTYRNLYAAFSDECSRYHRVSLCGISLGGVLAFHYAIEHPENVESLVLIAAPYKMPKLLLIFQNAVFRMMPERAFQQMGFAKKDVISLCKTMAELDFSDMLGQITCPTLIICGEKDSANRKASEKMAEKIKNAKMVIVEKTGHEVNVEAPEKLAEILRTFMYISPDLFV